MCWLRQPQCGGLLINHSDASISLKSHTPDNPQLVPAGCTDFSKNVTCFTATSFWPVAGCGATTNRTICAQNWGVVSRRGAGAYLHAL